AVAATAGSLNRYPDRDAVALRTGLAAYLNAEAGVRLTAAQVWAANGSNEIILQILQAFGGPGRTALGFEPSYAMHPTISKVANTRWIDAFRDEDFGLEAERALAAIAEHQPDVVFLTSPNNPTGTALDHEAIKAVLSVAPGMVVVDEAYGEFRRSGTPSALELLPGNPRLIVTRTMSKAFALAGARLGYLAADPAVLDALLLVRLPYHLSSVTQAVAETALTFRDELLGYVHELRRTRDETVQWLRAEGLRVADSDANFILFGTFDDRDALWQRMLDRGVLIRAVGPPQWLRVSVGTPDEMAAFRTVLKESL
ncbi:histidinol-phosphate transaminase, partial [Actinocorallia lasiicapitis]